MKINQRQQNTARVNTQVEALESLAGIASVLALADPCCRRLKKLGFVCTKSAPHGEANVEL
jgi:hypothetical protein